MISFNYECDFSLKNETQAKKWISKVIETENKKEGELNYIFCDDNYLHKLNQDFLGHDTLTDIISFDYTMGNLLSGDIYISVERVRDNSKSYNVSYEEELHRVMVHGILHYCGYNDKTALETKDMRQKEELYLKLI